MHTFTITSITMKMLFLLSCIHAIYIRGSCMLSMYSNIISHKIILFALFILLLCRSQIKTDSNGLTLTDR